MAAIVKTVSTTVSSLALVSAFRPIQIAQPKQPRFNITVLSTSSLSPEVMAMLQNPPEEFEAQ
jgi:hypothetical protein